MTETRKTLIEQLVQVQNDPKNWNRDIMTITGFMTDEEVARHLNKEAANLVRRAA